MVYYIIIILKKTSEEAPATTDAAMTTPHLVSYRNGFIIPFSAFSGQHLMV